MKHILSAVLIICILSSFSLRTLAQSGGQMSPCVIVVHNDNQVRNRNYSLTQRNQLGFGGYGIGNAFADPPPYSFDTSKPSDAIFNIFITKPTSVYIGYNELYIQPTDTIEVSVIGNNSLGYNLKIQRGISFFLNESGKKARLQIIDDSIAKLARFKSNAIHPDLSLFNDRAQETADKMANENPLINSSNDCLDFIRTYCLEKDISSFIARFLHPHPRTPHLDTGIVLSDTIKSFLINYSKEANLLKTVFFWSTFRNVAKYYVPQLKKNNFDDDLIRNIIQSYSTDVQQFLLVEWLKENNYIIKKDTVNHEKILAQITSPQFLPFKNKFKMNALAPAQDYISTALQNTLIYNYAHQQIKFGELFQRTKQPFIIFDFCGSWCPPCVREIAAYSEQKMLDTSKTLRPVWLFFESDSTKWQDVMLKYGLEKEDCFLMLDQKFELNFAGQYDWHGEFPHHVVFRKDGSIVKNGAPPLTDFNKSEIRKLE